MPVRLKMADSAFYKEIANDSFFQLVAEVEVSGSKMIRRILGEAKAQNCKDI